MESRRRKEEEERRKQEEADKKLAVSIDSLKEHLPVWHLETNCSLCPNSNWSLCFQTNFKMFNSPFTSFIDTDWS